MRYTSHSVTDISAMLEELGLKTLDELYGDIPATIRGACQIPYRKSLTELELRRELSTMAADNLSTGEATCFLGAGCYDSFVPAAVSAMLSRSEFVTAYTPYQPEISQGILQAIFEYQTFITKLTGLDVANASVYDGGSALASACSIAVETTQKKRVLIPKTLHPEYAQIAATYGSFGDYAVETISQDGGLFDLAALEKSLDSECAAVVIPYPNFFGLLEPVGEIVRLVRQKTEALVIMAVDPVAMAILKSPGDWGADIAVGDGQPLGIPMGFGGPHLGFMAVTNRLMRKIPGRLVGETVDAAGRRAFVLTLQAREQHIRREKASSNICSNQALCALAVSIYLAFVGPKGFRQAAERSHRFALYARKKFALAGFEFLHERPFFREFAIRVADPRGVNRAAALQWGHDYDNNLIGGYPLDDGILFAFTENRTSEEIDQLVATMQKVCGGSLPHATPTNEGGAA